MGWRHLLQGLRATLLAMATLAASVGAALAQDGLYDRPVLTLDPGAHTPALNRLDVDAAGRLAVTGADDGTVRLWRVADGTLVRTIRVPQGPGNVGKIYAVAISPDGQTVAAGGWTRTNDNDIYLFDTATGRMTQRLAGLPNVVFHLAFSPDGRYLAATLGGTNGLRVYDRDAGWAEQHKSAAYGDHSYGAAWAPAGAAARLATTSFDGKLRLYDANFALLHTIQTPHAQPALLAFSPDGSRLAVGFDDAPAVALYDTSSFAPLPPPETAGITNGNLVSVAFDAAGTLYAGGTYYESGNSPAVAWTPDGRRRSLPAGDNSLMSLRPLADGRLLVAAADPWLGLLRPDGKAAWANPPRRADLRSQHRNLSLSADGLTVDFGFEVWGKRRARFDLASRTLSASPPTDGRTAPPNQTDRPALTITDWEDKTTPSLNGTRLPLQPYERARSLAIHPDGQRFILGTEWRLRAFNAAGKQLWERPVPDTVWAVNISGNGRLVLAAYHDGTLRWHDMEDGRELLAFYPIDPGPGQAPKDWVAWTPEGVYTATESAQGILGWHINHGWDETAEFIPALRSDPTFRPQVISRVLHFRDVRRAQKFVDQQVQQADSHKPTASPKLTQTKRGDQGDLYLLNIGISTYGPNARALDLDYAHKDALDLGKALKSNAKSDLYWNVFDQPLTNAGATRRDIFRGLKDLTKRLQKNKAEERAKDTERPQNLIIFYFSGHGAEIDGDFYLLPHDVNARQDAIELTDKGIHVGRLRSEIARLAKYGRVVVMLDACRSGNATVAGSTLPVNAGRLHDALRGLDNVLIFTSSSGAGLSYESSDYQNGFFTEAVLRALTTQADNTGDGILDVTEFAGHLANGLKSISGNRQEIQPDFRFVKPLFVVNR